MELHGSPANLEPSHNVYVRASLASSNIFASTLNPMPTVHLYPCIVWSMYIYIWQVLYAMLVKALETNDVDSALQIKCVGDIPCDASERAEKSSHR